jgi:hypothetical protein
VKQSEIEDLFRVLQLETDEQRAAMRFEQGMIDSPLSIQVFTTDTTLCHEATVESRENA